MSKADIVIYKGIKFRRYPEADRMADRRYYRPNGKHIKNGVEALHREIWKDNYGLIPEGYHIHHIDNDPTNNNIDNLECVSPKEHAEKHPYDYDEEHLARIRELTKEWHESDEGREWHKKHGKKMWKNKEAETYTCKYCGKKFTAKTLHGNVIFCSNKCKSAWRYNQGLDDVKRTCIICGKEFTTNKYSNTKTCSGSCAMKLAWQNRKCERSRNEKGQFV